MADEDKKGGKLAVVVSVCALLISAGTLYQTSENAIIDDGNKLRAEQRIALISGVQKLQDWSSEIDDTYDRIQPILVQTSEEWEKSGSVLAARDALYQRILTIYEDNHKRIAEKAISTAYINLYRVNNDLPDEFEKHYTLLQFQMHQFESSLLEHTQNVVMSFAQNDTRISAEMGNHLRESVNKDVNIWRNQADPVIKGLTKVLVGQLRQLTEEQRFEWIPNSARAWIDKYVHVGTKN